jgi:hypothetical protein
MQVGESDRSFDQLHNNELIIYSLQQIVLTRPYQGRRDFYGVKDIIFWLTYCKKETTWKV